MNAGTMKFVGISLTAVLVLALIAVMPGVFQYYRTVPPVNLPAEDQAISVSQAAKGSLDQPILPDKTIDIERHMGRVSLLSFMLLTRKDHCRYTLTLTDMTNQFIAPLFSTGPGLENKPCTPNTLIDILKKAMNGALKAGVAIGAIKDAFDYLGPEIANELQMAPDVAEAFKNAVSNLVK